MRDFNFFSEYVYVQNSSLSKKLIVPLLLIILLSVLVYVNFYMTSNVNELQTTVDANNKIINSKEYTEIIEEEKILKADIEQMVTTQIDLVTFETMLPYNYRVTEDLLEKILTTIPRNVAFSSYNITPLGIAITAVSSDYSYIAELEYNLRSLDIFENVFIRVVENTEDEGYIFNIELTFGGDLIE